jgi:hypothetical protein
MDQNTNKSQTKEPPIHSKGGAQQSIAGSEISPPQKQVSSKRPHGHIDREHPIGGEMPDIVGRWPLYQNAIALAATTSYARVRTSTL